jgi:hypothetical protein
MRRARLLFILLSMACIPYWSQAGGLYTAPSNEFTAVLPQGWMKARDKELLATRDGPLLQRIYSKTARFGEPQKQTNKAVTKGMLPAEAAEIVRDEILSEGAAQRLVVLENLPARLDGRPGFKLVFAYKGAEGLHMKGLLYGAVGDDALYGLGYTAPERYYFDHDLPAFEQVRASFRMTRFAH